MSAAWVHKVAAPPRQDETGALWHYPAAEPLPPAPEYAAHVASVQRIDYHELPDGVARAVLVALADDGLARAAEVEPGRWLIRLALVGECRSGIWVQPRDWRRHWSALFGRIVAECAAIEAERRAAVAAAEHEKWRQWMLSRGLPTE